MYMTLRVGKVMQALKDVGIGSGMGGIEAWMVGGLYEP